MKTTEGNSRQSFSNSEYYMLCFTICLCVVFCQYKHFKIKQTTQTANGTEGGGCVRGCLKFQTHTHYG